MNIKTIIFCFALIGCHSTPPAVTPATTEQPKVVNVTPTEKKAGTATVKNLGCQVFTEEDMFFSNWFSKENAVQFGSSVCDGKMPNEDQDCFDQFGIEFVKLCASQYYNADKEAAIAVFMECANHPSINCFEDYEKSLLETHNAVCQTTVK